MIKSLLAGAYRLLPFLLLAMLSLAPSSFARRSWSQGRDVPSHIQLSVERGGSIMLRVTGREYRDLTSLRAVSYVRGRRRVSTDVLVGQSGYAVGGRWLEIEANAQAAITEYRIEGVRGRAMALVLPLTLKVVSSSSDASNFLPRTRVRTVTIERPPTSELVKTNPRLAYRTFLTEIYKLDDYGVPDDELIPVPGPKDYDKPPDVGTMAGDIGATTTQVHGVTPEGAGQVGQIIDITGEGLPTCQVYLGTHLLAITSQSLTKISARLPSYAMKADLRLVSGDKWGILAEDYEVRTDPITFNHFPADATEVSWKTAYLLSLLCFTAYAPTEAKAKAAIEALGLKFELRIDKATWWFADPGQGIYTGATVAIVASNADAVFVTFQGSTTDDYLSDFIDGNLDAMLYPVPSWGAGVMVHHGFNDSMVLGYNDIRDKVQGILGNKKLWITGHSLGGQLSVLTAFRMALEEEIAVQGVYTFGASCVGNGGLPFTWQAVYDQKIPNTHRFNIEEDPVPCLFFAPAFFHVGKTHNLYADGSYIFNDPHMFAWGLDDDMVDDFFGKHMGYWDRIRQELVENDPASAAVLPASYPFDW